MIIIKQHAAPQLKQCLSSGCDQARPEAVFQLLPVEVLADEDQLVDALLIRLPGLAATLGAAAELQEHVHALEDIPEWVDEGQGQASGMSGLGGRKEGRGAAAVC